MVYLQLIKAFAKRSGVLLLLFLCGSAFAIHGQEVQQPSSLNIGDAAPPMRVSEWIKGKPVQKFEKGHVYVLEFWATWCRPCYNLMPHLSALAHKYKGKVTVIGINVAENKAFPKERTRAIVDSMGRRMKYAVAFEDSNLMKAVWMNTGIPGSIVVNAEGRIAWIGYPNLIELGSVLPQIIDKTWDIDVALANRNRKKQLEEMNYEAGAKLRDYLGDADLGQYYGQPDSTLFWADEMIKKDSGLKYSPSIVFYTFSALLKTDMRLAYEYGAQVISASSYPFSNYIGIINGISSYSDRLSLSPQLYKLGIYAMQKLSPPNPKNLMTISEWYWRAGEKSNSILYLKKAHKAAKRAAKHYEPFF